MIKINLTQGEIARLGEFAVKELNSGHMDAEDFIIPEYQILKDKIAKSTYFIELNNTEVEILCGWINDGVAGSRIRKIEDELLAAKIYDAVHEEYKNIKSDYQFRITKLREGLNTIAKLAGKDEIGDTGLSRLPETAAEQINNTDSPGSFQQDDHTDNPFEQPAAIPSQPGKADNSKSPDKNINKLSEREKAKNVSDLANKMKNLAKKLK